MNLDISNANLIDNLTIDSYGYYNTRYSNIKGVAVVDESATIQPVSSASTSEQPVTTTEIPAETTSQQAIQAPVLQSVISKPLLVDVEKIEEPASTPRFIDAQTQPRITEQTQTVTSPQFVPPLPVYTGGMGGSFGGGAMGGGGAAPKTTSTSASKDSGMPTKQAPLTDKNIFKRFWFWGLLIGAGAGYYYAKTKNKKVLDATLIASAIGGGIGLGLEMSVKKRMENK